MLDFWKTWIKKFYQWYKNSFWSEGIVFSHNLELILISNEDIAVNIKYGTTIMSLYHKQSAIIYDEIRDYSIATITYKCLRKEK